MSSQIQPIINSLDVCRFRPSTRSKHHGIMLIGPDHPNRAQAEALVQKVYRKAYQAHISSFYPFLLAISNPDGDLEAVAGIRPAGDAPLFSEHYLDKPISELLDIPRNQLVEAGNLAPAGLGKVRWTIAAVTAFLHGAGFSHVTFTAVPLLHNAFRRMGLQPEFIAAAHQERLSDVMQDEWGSYYQCNPAVYSGSIDYGYQSLITTAGTDKILNQIWRKAHFLGQYSSYALQQAGS